MTNDMVRLREYLIERYGIQKAYAIMRELPYHPDVKAGLIERFQVVSASGHVVVDVER